MHDGRAYLLEELDFASATVRRRNHYVQSRPLDDLGDEEFMERYRMSKQSFQKLHQMIEGNCKDARGSREDPGATDTRQQLLVALRFYAVGTIHQVTGDLHGTSIANVCNIVARVSTAIASLFFDYVKWPSHSQLLQVSCSCCSSSLRMR